MSKLLSRQFAFSQDVSSLIAYIFAAGYTCSLGEVYRPPETAEIYAKKGTGIRNSKHCMRLAIDINIFCKDKYLTKTSEYKFAGDFWESLDDKNKWGGRFSDGNHFERNNL